MKIYSDKGVWFLEDNGFDNTAVYLNNYRVRKSVLHMGDVIFTNGLKIIWQKINILLELFCIQEKM